MKQATIKVIENKLRNEISKAGYELRKNTREINRLAGKQKELKLTISGLYEILRLIKEGE